MCSSDLPNECARTFVDARTPDGRTSRLITGFSCEKGTVESHQALRELTARRKTLRVAYPNLVEMESAMLFRHFYEPEPLPEEGHPMPRRVSPRRWCGLATRGAAHHAMARSSAEAHRRRESLQIEIGRAHV